MNKYKLITLSVISTLLISGCSTRNSSPVIDDTVNIGSSNTNLSKRNNNQDSISPIEEVMVNSFDNNIVITDDSSFHDGVNYQNNLGFESIFFKYDSYIVEDDMIKYMTFNITKLQEDYPDSEIIIEGNCDEWGSDEYNQALGFKRALSIKNYLVSEGFSEEKIHLKSYGEHNPLCNQKSKDCYAKNRRVDITIY